MNGSFYFKFMFLVLTTSCGSAINPKTTTASATRQKDSLPSRGSQNQTDFTLEQRVFLSDQFRILKTIETFEIQRKLGDASLRSNLSSVVLKRMDNLQQYFNLLSQLSGILLSGGMTATESSFQKMFDSTTHDWSDAWKSFCQAEKLWLPNVALFVGFSSDPSTNRGSDVTIKSKIENLIASASADATEAARSMRRAKLLMRSFIGFATLRGKC